MRADTFIVERQLFAAVGALAGQQLAEVRYVGSILGATPGTVVQHDQFFHTASLPRQFFFYDSLTGNEQPAPKQIALVKGGSGALR